MKMQPAARLVRERLGHHREHRTVRFGDRVRRLLEQHHVVGTAQRIRMPEVDFVLAVRVFMVELQHIEAAARERLVQRAQERGLPRQALQVVTGLGQPIGVVGGKPFAIGTTPQQEELWLDAGLQRPATLGQPRHSALENLTRAGVERCAIDEAIADDACVAGHPRQGLRGGCIAAREVFGAGAGAAKPGARDRGPRKTRAGLDHVLQVFQRHPLALGHAVHIGELHQQRVHALCLEPLAQRLPGLSH